VQSALFGRWAVGVFVRCALDRLREVFGRLRALYGNAAAENEAGHFPAGRPMSRSLQSPRHEALREFLVRERKAARLTQQAVAKKLGRYQSYVATVESGQRRVDVVEFLELAEAIGFDPSEIIRRVARKKG